MTEQKTIAQQWGVTKFPFELYDVDGNQTYYENSDGTICERRSPRGLGGFGFETQSTDGIKIQTLLRN